MSTTFEKATPATPGPSPVDAAEEAARADVRAAQAKIAADRATKAAKEARATASEAKREATKLHEAADPKLREREPISTTQAKLRFMEAARAIDPIGSVRNAVREHPFITVGAALGTGAVVGASGVTLGAIGRLAWSAMKFAKPLVATAAEFAARHVAAQHAANAAPPTGTPDATTPPVRTSN